MPRICLSYRRSDSADIVGRIYDRLAARYGAEAVFMDVADIPYGADFRKHIQSVLKEAHVLLAAIGPGWLRQQEADVAKIHDRRDPVHVEIQTALRQRILLIPVLVDGAVMPRAHELPHNLRDLAYRNAISVSSGVDFEADIQRLLIVLDQALADEPGAQAPARHADQGPQRKADSSHPLLALSRAARRHIPMAPYFLASVILLVLAHYLIVVKLDTDPVYLRIAAILVPLACGFLLFRNLGASLGAATLLGLAAAIVAIAGMMTVVGLVDRHAILPQSQAGWQEAAEYMLTIAFATGAGDLLARVLYSIPKRWRPF